MKRLLLAWVNARTAGSDGSAPSSHSDRKAKDAVAAALNFWYQSMEYVYIYIIIDIIYVCRRIFLGKIHKNTCTKPLQTHRRGRFHFLSFARWNQLEADPRYFDFHLVLWLCLRTGPWLGLLCILRDPALASRKTCCMQDTIRYLIDFDCIHTWPHSSATKAAHTHVPSALSSEILYMKHNETAINSHCCKVPYTYSMLQFRS